MAYPISEMPRRIFLCNQFWHYKAGVTYAQAIESKGMVGWKRIEKQCSDIYASNRSEKIVLFREIYDLAKKNRLGFLVIGANASKIDSICDNFLRSDKEEVIVVSKGGDELVRQGGVEDEVIDKIMEKETLSVNSSKEVRNSNYRNYEIYNFANEATGTTVYKIVPKIGVKGSDLYDSCYTGCIAFRLSDWTVSAGFDL